MGRTTMNRWALQYYAAAEARLRALAARAGERYAARVASRGDRGQTSFEYLGIAVVIAVIIGVLAGTTDIGDKIKSGITDAINNITGGS
jgi:Flp pilus assembly pilin Flp